MGLCYRKSVVFGVGIASHDLTFGFVERLGLADAITDSDDAVVPSILRRIVNAVGVFGFCSA